MTFSPEFSLREKVVVVRGRVFWLNDAVSGTTRFSLGYPVGPRCEVATAQIEGGEYNEHNLPARQLDPRRAPPLAL